MPKPRHRRNNIARFIRYDGDAGPHARVATGAAATSLLDKEGEQFVKEKIRMDGVVSI